MVCTNNRFDLELQLQCVTSAGLYPVAGPPHKEYMWDCAGSGTGSVGAGLLQDFHTDMGCRTVLKWE